jgi:hypothetical protein
MRVILACLVLLALACTCLAHDAPYTPTFHLEIGHGYHAAPYWYPHPRFYYPPTPYFYAPPRATPWKYDYYWHRWLPAEESPYLQPGKSLAISIGVHE